jgi:hypothetical protein
MMSHLDVNLRDYTNTGRVEALPPGSQYAPD